MKKGGWVSEVLHASAQQEVVRYGLAVRAQELEVNPRVPADSTEGRLFRELDRLARRDEHDAHLDGLVVLVRTTDRVIVVSEDDLRVDSGQAQLAAQADRRACVVAGSTRDVGRRERPDHEARIRGEDALDAASEEDLIGHRVPARVHELNPDEGVAASPAQYGLLRDREALPGWNQHGRGRRRLDVLVRPFTLFWNVIWTPSPANASSPERVIVGPGELSHPDEDASTWTATGIGTSALTVCFPIESPAVEMVDA